MTEKELHKRINQSEKDFQNGQFKTSAELLAKYQQCFNDSQCFWYATKSTKVEAN